MRPLLLLSVLLATAAAVRAQPAVPVGTEVRVRLAEGPLVGLALGVGADTLVVADPATGDPTAVSYGDMESPGGRMTRLRQRDMVRGGLLGAGIGAIPLAAITVYGMATEGYGGRWVLGAFYVAPLVPIGAGVGAAVGAVGPTDWWERVPTRWVSSGPFAVRPVVHGADGDGGARGRPVVREERPPTSAEELLLG